MIIMRRRRIVDDNEKVENEEEVPMKTLGVNTGGVTV